MAMHRTIGLPLAGLALAALLGSGPARAADSDLWMGTTKKAAPAPTPAPAPAPVAGGSREATVADLEAAERAVDAAERALAEVQDRLPFGVRNVTFVNRKAEAFRNIDRRSTNVFAPGEPLLTYIEPLGYGVREKDGGYNFGMTMDFRVRTAAGEVVAGKDAYNSVDLNPQKRRVPFYVDLSLNLTGAPPGDYVLVYTLHDAVSGKTTSFEQPFTIRG
ncbi:hypothetical protein [Methylobacterium sp. A54F]